MKDLILIACVAVTAFLVGYTVAENCVCECDCECCDSGSISNKCCRPMQPMRRGFCRPMKCDGDCSTCPKQGFCQPMKCNGDCSTCPKQELCRPTGECPCKPTGECKCEGCQCPGCPQCDCCMCCCDCGCKDPCHLLPPCPSCLPLPID